MEERARFLWIVEKDDMVMTPDGKGKYHGKACTYPYIVVSFNDRWLKVFSLDEVTLIK